MADGYDRLGNEGGRGRSFVMGLLTGTVLGAGLGMLFAPKAGSELRNQISSQAGNLANSASEGVRRAQETAGEWADRGREMYDKARDAVSRGADEARNYVRDASSGSSQNPSSMPGGSPYGGGSSIGGSSAPGSMPGSSSSGMPPRRS